KWLSSTMIILYSDLVDACRENPKALDMILGHELGHISAGHLKATWFLLPGLAFPFLGKAYSRAREFTCDRYGRDLCGDDEAAIQGLALLAVGRSLASQVNIKEYTDQSHSLKSLSMTLGRWMSTHPPLCDRILALKPELGQISYAGSNLKAISILFLMICVPMGGIILIKETNLKAPTVQSRVR
ncbi:MAG TPA: M48 family metallopeptidase, partial [Oligoflexus sp.]|uniref:M48 family metallopeptidase n=1 Tax=Oligoflexus sp. TaxID=1971216 RepID=UPI002D54D6CF